MNEYNLSKKFIEIIEQLNQLTFESQDLNQLDKIHELKNQIDNYFPHAIKSLKFNGKIEDIIIKIHQKFKDRILIPNEQFDILMNAYISENYKINTSDIQHIQDCLILHYPKSNFKFEVFRTNAIIDENLLVMLEFKTTEN